MKSFFATNRLFFWEGSIILLFILSYFWAPVFWVAILIIIIGLGLLVYDIFMLNQISSQVSGRRSKHEKLALGDIQTVQYTVRNQSKKKVFVKLVDNFPFQFQRRAIIKEGSVLPSNDLKHEVDVKPLERGKYQFGAFLGYISAAFPGLLEKRITLDKPILVKVYPSVIQMKKYAMYVFSKSPISYGIRQIRTIGDNDEFEHIRNYVSGDNIKSINWKATSRTGSLMVNQFQDTRSQEVYCVIDKGRSMLTSFEGMTLLDYAINSTLVISNIVLQKYDKAGLVTFSNKIDDVLKAVSHPRQLEFISERLYAQTSVFKESDFERLHLLFNGNLAKRSIVFLFTNFDDQVDLERDLSYIKAMARRHLLIVISFINTSLIQKRSAFVNSKSTIYKEAIIDQLLNEKEKIMQVLSRHGIQYILTKPESLSVEIINKYLEIKAKRMK